MPSPISFHTLKKRCLIICFLLTATWMNAVELTTDITQPSCGNVKGTIVITAPLAPVGTQYFYSLNGGQIQNEPTYSNLAPGTYTVAAKDGMGTLIASKVITINTLPAPPATPTVTGTSPGACGASGTIEVTSPTGAPFSYSIDGINYQTSAMFNNVAAGTYHVTVKNGSSCASPDFAVTIAAPPGAPAQPQISTIVQPTCTSPTGSFTIENYNAAFSYTVTPSANVIVTGNTVTAPAGSYSITATSGSCASAATNFIILPQPITPSIADKTTSVCGSEFFTINLVNGPDIIPSGTTYSWNAPSGTGFTGGASGNGESTISGSPINTTALTATATYIVTPSNGSCTGNSFKTTVIINPTPKISDKSASFCSEAPFNLPPANGTDILPSGTTYYWQAPSGTGFTGGVGGNGTTVSGTLTNTSNTPATAIYTITPSAAGCKGANFTFTVTINPKPVLSGLTSVCQGYSTQLTPSIPAGSPNPWINYNPAIISLDAAGNITGISTGTAIITYTDQHNCSSKISFAVNTQPSITITKIPTCAADLLTYSLEVTLNDGTLTSSAGTATNTGGTAWTISAIPAGTNIILTVKNASNCTATLAINAPDCNCPAINAPVSAGDKAYCTGSALPQLSATVGANETIDWYASSAGGTPLLSNSLTFTPSTSGTYYAEARNKTTNCKSTTRTPISALAKALPQILSQTNMCEGIHFGMQASGTASAVSPWISSNPAVATIDNGGVISGIKAGTSTITYTDNYGCQASVIMTVNGLPSITGSLKACVGSTTQLTGSGAPAAVNAWMSLSPSIATIDNSGLVTALSGNYASIMYTNSNGCFTKAEIAIGSPTAITAEPLATQTICQNSTPSALNVTANGTNLQYQWYSNTVNSTVSGTAISGATQPKYSPPSATAGTLYYYCIVTGDCTSVTSAISSVTVNATPAAPASPTNGIICDAGTTTISATVTSGETIDWYGASSGGTPLASGTSFITPALSTSTTYYAETRSSTSGCISSARTAVNASVYSTTITSHQDASRCGNGSVKLSATAPGTINWYDASSGGNIIGSGNSLITPPLSTTTSYYIDATSGGCTSPTRTPVVATIYQIPATPEIQTTQPNCLTSTGSIEITNAATGNNYSIDGTNYTNTTGLFSNVAVGSYQITAKNGGGCSSATTTATIVSPTILLPKSGFTLSTNTIDPKHNIVAGSIDPANGVSYLWNFGDGNSGTGDSFYRVFNISGQEGHVTISLTATDVIGCSSSTSQVVTVYPFIPNVFTPNNDGYNDLFMPGYELQVFDRTGKLLFSGNQGWNGNLNGVKLDPDTYFYLFKYLDASKIAHEKQGYVTLMR